MATKRTRKRTRTTKPKARKSTRRRIPTINVDTRRLAREIFENAICPTAHINCRCSVDPEIDDNCCSCDAATVEHAYPRRGMERSLAQLEEEPT